MVDNLPTRQQTTGQRHSTHSDSTAIVLDQLVALCSPSQEVPPVMTEESQPSSLPSLTFEEPSPGGSRKRAPVFTQSIAEALKPHPGRWAVLGHYTYSPGSIAIRLNKTHVDFEFTSRVSHDDNPNFPPGSGKKHFKLFGRYTAVADRRGE